MRENSEYSEINNKLFEEFDNIKDPNDELGASLGDGLRKYVIEKKGYLSFFLLTSFISKKYNICGEEREYTEKEILEMNKKALELALDYLYPLLKDGKLKLKLIVGFNSVEEVEEELKEVKTKEQKEKLEDFLKQGNIDWKEKQLVGYVFYKEQADEAIQEVRRIREKIKYDKKKREFFEMFDVMFTLPENEFDW